MKYPRVVESDHKSPTRVPGMKTPAEAPSVVEAAWEVPNAANGNSLFVLNKQGRLSVVDTHTLVVTRTRLLSGDGGPDSIEFGAQMAVDKDGNRLFLTGGGRKTTLYHVDAADLRVISQINLNNPAEDVALSGNGERLYILTSKHLTVLNSADLREMSRLDLPAERTSGDYRMLLVSER